MNMIGQNSLYASNSVAVVFHGYLSTIFSIDVPLQVSKTTINYYQK